MSDQAAAPPPARPPGHEALDQLSGTTPLVGPGAPQLSDGTVPVDVIALTHSLLRAINVCATAASGQVLAQDAKDLGAAALGFAQAVITLDPSRLKGGDTPASQRAAVPPVTPPGLPATDRNHDGVIGQS